MAAMISKPWDDARATIIIVTVACTLLALSVVSLRVLTRLRIVKDFGSDDAVICAAMLLSLTGLGLVVAEAHYGAGRHIGDVPPDMYSAGLRMNFISQPVYVVAVATVKVSVGLALLRIAGHTGWRYFIIVVMVIMGVWALTSIFLSLLTLRRTITLSCNPVSIHWDLTAKGSCWPAPIYKGLAYFDAALNIATDITFALGIPIPLFWSMNVRWPRRITPIVILGLGVFACVAATIKAVYLYCIGNAHDWLWESRHITIWHVAELNTGIVAASIPAVVPLLGTCFGAGEGAHNQSASISQATSASLTGTKSPWLRMSGAQNHISAATQESLRQWELNVEATNRDRARSDSHALEGGESASGSGGEKST